MSLRLISNLQPSRKLGEVLVELNFVKPPQLEKALLQVKAGGPRLGAVLVTNNIITDKQLATALAAQYKLEVIDLEGAAPKPEALKCLPEDMARKECLLPLAIENNKLVVAVFDPMAAMNIQSGSWNTKYELKLKIATQRQINKALETAYAKGDGLQSIVHGLITHDEANASVELLVNKILENAVKNEASDIHIEPDEAYVRVRERVDGILEEVNTIPLELGASLVSRLKILANLDFAEKRNAQDGRFRLTVAGRVSDFRISTLPTVRGEKVVMRILDKSQPNLELHNLGMSLISHKNVERMLAAPYGIIFVTGPTGSGKSTTVYSMLGYLNSLEKNITTIEDPVEQQFNIINQVQVQPKIGFTFANILRAILRQDPDIIMVGEIRDKETADITVRAALTGHLVITTLHTNNSVSTITRLIDMGIDPTLISSSLLGVISQRLVRRLCPACCKKEKISEQDLLSLETNRISPDTIISYPVGCPACRNLGFKGRAPIFEVLAPDAEIRKAITTKQSEEVIFSKLTANANFKNMRDDGLDKVLAHVTTPLEVLKATVSDD